jgi:hypothetical protein
MEKYATFMKNMPIGTYCMIFKPLTRLTLLYAPDFCGQTPG